MDFAGVVNLKLGTQQWKGRNEVEAGVARGAVVEAGRLRGRARETEMRVRIATQERQSRNTELIQERSQQVEYWAAELKRAIQGVREETGLLKQLKNRLEKSLSTTEISQEINKDSLRARGRRLLPDDVDDEVEQALNAEGKLIRDARDLLMKTIDQVLVQISNNDMIKARLEEDWSNTHEALELDVTAGALSNTSKELQYKPGAAVPPDREWDPTGWAHGKSNVLSEYANEKSSSEQLRAVVEQVLEDVARDLTEQSDEVEARLNRRVDQLDDTRRQQQDILEQEVIPELVGMEKQVESLRNALHALNNPTKVAQSRLRVRQRRVANENTSDPPLHGLLEEVGELGMSSEAIRIQLEEGENTIHSLRQKRLQLDREITTRIHSINIDRDKCLRMRRRYPAQTRLLGY